MAKISVTNIVGGVLITAFVYAGVDWALNSTGPIDQSGPQKVTFIEGDSEEDLVNFLGDSSKTTSYEDVDSNDGIIIWPEEDLNSNSISSYNTYTKDAYTYTLEETALPLYNNLTGQIDTKSPDLAVIEHYQELVEDIQEKVAINDIEGVKRDATKAYKETANFLFHNAPLTEYNVTRNMLTEDTYVELLANCVLIDSMAVDYVPYYKEEITTSQPDDYAFYQEAIFEIQDQIIQKVGEHAYFNVKQNSEKGSFK